MKDFLPAPAPRTEKMKYKPLTSEEVGLIIDSFLKHIAENWDTYRNNLPALGRTMMFYNEFAYGIRFLPENDESDYDDEEFGYGIDFNPKDPLLDGPLQDAFGTAYTQEIADLIYDAWPLRVEFHGWEGYEEPIEDTPETLMAQFPSVFPTLEDARRHMYEEIGTGFYTYQGKRMRLGPCGTPKILYAGFTTAQEFPAQRVFLDTIRNHPRINLGIQLMEEMYLLARVDDTRRDIRFRKLEELTRDIDPSIANLSDDEKQARIRKLIDYSAKERA